MRNIIRSAVLWLTFLSSMLTGTAQVDKHTGPPPPAAIEYNPKAWREFSSDEGGFSVRMPGVPQSKTSSADASPSTFTLNTGTGEYSVLYRSLSAREQGQIESVLDSARSNFLSGDKTRLLSEASIVRNGLSGREWMVESGDKIITARAFIVKNRYYQLSFSTQPNVVFYSGKASPPPVRLTDFYEKIVGSFFGSFQLLAK